MTGARRLLAAGGALLAVATLIGALAAHLLRTRLAPAQLESLHTAVNYQFFNGLGVLLVALLLQQRDTRPLRASGALLLAGTVSFSGGIYLMLAGAPPLLGFITPLGGLLLIIGWITFSVAALRP